MMGEYKGSVCSKCGGEITCRYVGDTGTVDHYFTWEHICKKCGHQETFDAFSSGDYTTPEELVRTLCPGCGQIAPNQKF